MKITTTVAYLVLLFQFCFAQTPSKEFTTSWNSIANASKISQTNVINVKRLGADPTGQEPADKYVQVALENSKQTGAVVYFPAGTYLLTQSIRLSSNQYLAGDGSSKTTLRFDLNGSGHLIYSRGQTFAQWTSVKTSAFKNDQVLYSDNSYLQPGDLIRIKVDDNDRITSDWAKGTVGQIVKVTSVSDDKIELGSPLRLDLNTAEHPEIIKIVPEKNIGVINMRIVRNDATAGQTDNIHFEYTQNALVSGVHSDSCNFAHVNNVYSLSNRVEGSYFSNAFNYGNGGKAYGVVLSFTSGECMVENNIFRKLRHSILFQAGPSGNIVGYNYSYEPYWTGVFTPADFAGDVVFHGNYPFLNLIEGNIVQNIVIDNSHGINGPGNTFLRNRAENAGIFMNCSPASDNQVFIGNEITGTGNSTNGYVPFPRGLYSLCGDGHYQYGNSVHGKMLPDMVNSMVNSLYFQQPPPFITGAFPAVGYPQKEGVHKIPAYTRSNEKIKTIDYEFDIILGFKFTGTDVKKVESGGMVIKWTTNSTDECDQFEVIRSQDNGAPQTIAHVNCDDKTAKIPFFQFIDYSFKTTCKSIAYQVVYTDVYGDKIPSDKVTVNTSGQPLSVKSDGKGNLLFDRFIEHINVYDMRGILVQSYTVNASNYKLPSELLSGIYVIEATGDGVYSRKKIALFR